MKIAALLAQGMSTAKAAAELALATGTVSAQVSSAHHRLGVCHRYGLIHACYVHALIPRPDTALPPGGAEADEVQILWRLALDDSYDEITHHATLSSREVMKEKIDALRSRWDAVNDPHLITLGWRYGVLDASRGTGGHQLI
ncbi:LuxR C-terminal-related transcriptional regulator [Streptomyces sp. NPDC059991]|uniref:LuxR C-terminal-related transcriptional regulator n=1 Tax=Streptomyces sp. NPDC059991 TaxID=3347028 RepID=UPI00368AD990